MSISEDLKARVRKKFNELYSNDEKISKQWSAIQSGSATYEEAHAYGERLGDLIREALNEVTGEDLLARCLCHEIDHLDGILYTDKMDYEITDDDEEENS